MITLDDMVGILEAVKKDSWGIDIVSNEPTKVECKIMYSLKNEELQNADGEYVHVTAKIYFDSLFNIGLSDRIVFTDDFGNKHNLEVLSVKPIKDFSNKILYTKVIV